MKKVVFILCALISVSTAAKITANPNSGELNVAIVKRGSVVKVFYKSDEPGNARVSISSSTGREFFTDYVKSKNGFSRPYNISSLPAGTYTINIKDKSGLYSEQIVIKDKDQFVYKVTPLKGESGRYMLSIPAENSGLVNVSIFNDAGRLVYSGEEKINSNFAKLYNLKKIEGEVTFVVKPQ